MEISGKTLVFPVRSASKFLILGEAG
jgi:hypothetical protein